MTDALARYLKAWNLSEPQPLAVTPTSRVYAVTSGEARVVLKLLTPVGVKDEQSGAAALRWYDGDGAVRLLRADRQAHLLEYADGEELSAMVKRGDDERAAVIIGDVLNSLHASRKSPQPEGLVPLRRRFRSLFRRAKADQRAGSSSVFVRAVPVVEGLLAEPRQVCVLHGDIHHENIRHKAGRGWLAFDPKGVLGERTYDTANTLCNPWDLPALVEDEARLLRIAAILAKTTGIELPRLLAFAFAYACLSASWFLDIGQDTGSALRVAELVEPHLRRE